MCRVYRARHDQEPGSTSAIEIAAAMNKIILTSLMRCFGPFDLASAKQQTPRNDCGPDMEGVDHIATSER